jgi:Ca2+-transporting ATPase
LPAVEILGSTTVIGSDKTGTLTENRMTVQRVWCAGRLFAAADRGEPGDDRGLRMADAMAIAEHHALYLTLLTGVLTNEAQIYLVGDSYERQGDPTEAALLVCAARAGIEPEEAREQYEPLLDIPFEPEHQYSAAIRSRDGERFVFVKGAPERVLAMCVGMMGDEGPLALDAAAVHAAATDLASKGLRVLAMAYRRLGSPREPPLEAVGPEGLTFLGLQGMRDPPRADVKEAIAGCRRAGIRVLMITGDHTATARAIGEELGIAQEGDPVISGAELSALDDDALAERVEEAPIYARTSPQDKLRIVHALRRRGEVVAVTGDGVNDAPALKAADLGIAMGKSGTDGGRHGAGR